MFNFIRTHIATLPTILLILMLAVPFLLYYFARSGSTSGVVFFLAFLGTVMLVTMKK